MIRVTIAGRKATRDAIRALAGKGAAVVNSFVTDAAEDVLTEVVDSIQSGPKTGRIYQRYNPARIHQASAPGQAPADDLGTLANSYTVEFIRINQYAYRADVGSPLFYSRILEYGNARIAARPHLSTAIDLVSSRVGVMLDDAWRSR